MRRPLTPIVPALLAIACTAGLASCGSSSDGSDSASAASSATSAAAPASTPAATTTDVAASSPATSPASTTTGKTPGVDAPPSPGTTAAGTQLKIGQSATLDYKDSSNNKSGIVTITVKSITKASMSDFKNMDLDAKEKASSPYYLKLSVKNAGKTDLSGTTPQHFLGGLDDRDQEQNSLIVMGTFDACNEDTQPKDFGPGKSFDACQTYLIPGGGSLKGATWSVYDPATNKLNVTWK
ncbi:MAG: hypothetical protein AAGC46_03175 [Solirubrobacteraceae bacterium]|nr:hypothetical protein [Patulibacter sp.]